MASIGSGECTCSIQPCPMTLYGSGESVRNEIRREAAAVFDSHWRNSPLMAVRRYYMGAVDGGDRRESIFKRRPVPNDIVPILKTGETGMISVT